MASIAFARESLTSQLWDEAIPLLFSHWKEVAHFQDVELTPDRERYAQLEQRGILRTFTARTETGLLVGYALFAVTPTLHYSQLLQAMQDVIYVQPDHRGTMPIRFFRFCEEQLFGEGVDVICHHTKAAHSFGKLIERQGFEVMDILYVKRRPVPAARAFPHIASATEARG